MARLVSRESGRNFQPHYDVPVLCVSNLLIANPRLEEKMAYSIVKVIMEHRSDWVIVHKEAEKITPQSAVVGSPIPYHPGAIKYYQEKGLKVPAF